MRRFGFRKAGAPTASAGTSEPAHPPVTPLPALTSLRFLAAFYVLVFHYDRFFFPGAPADPVIALGHTGVTFFFVLSGFILAYTYQGVDLGSAAARVRFLRARFARIYPAFLLSLAISLPWFLAWVAKSAPPLKWFMASGAVLAPLGLHAWVPGAACSLNCASWSISVEVFFYLLFPLLLPLVLRRPAEYALAALALWAMFGALCTLIWSRFAPGVSLVDPESAGAGAVLLAQAIKYNPLLRLPEFVAGLALFACWRRIPPNSAVWTIASLAFAAAAAVALVLAESLVPQPVMHNGLTVLVWAPLILAGASLRGGLLATPAFVFLGRISFALYLLHMPAYGVVNTLDHVALHGLMSGTPWLAAGIATALALAGAVVVHLAVEEPARRFLLRAETWRALPLLAARGLPRRIAMRVAGGMAKR